MATGLEIEMRFDSVERLIKEGKNLPLLELHESYGDEMVNLIEERFDSSTDAFGKKFKDIKEEYVYRLAGGSGRKKIRKPGDAPLKGGLGSVGGKNLSQSFSFEARSDQVAIGTPSKTYKFSTAFPNNNQGPRKTQPLREVMGVNLNKDFTRFLDLTDDFVNLRLESA